MACGMKVTKIKAKTARLYTDSGMYMGWRYIKDNRRMLRDWIRDGNEVRIGDKVLRHSERSKDGATTTYA